MIPHRGLFRRLLSLSLIAVAALALEPTAQGQEAPATQAVVGLAYNAADNVLIKALPNAVFRSRDEGVTWEQVGPPIESGAVAALALTAGAGVVYVAGPGIGVLQLGDNGDWISGNGDLPSLNVTALTAHADQPQTLYAYIPESGIFRTRDGGGVWQLMDRGPPDIRRLLHSNMPGSMETGWLYAVTGAGLQVSMDCFCLWRAIGTDVIADATAIAFDPGDPSRFFAASDSGLFRSTNGGQDWVAFVPPATQITALLVMPSGALIAGGADGLLFRSLDDGVTWEAVGD